MRLHATKTPPPPPVHLREVAVTLGIGSTAPPWPRVQSAGFRVRGAGCRVLRELAVTFKLCLSQSSLLKSQSGLLESQCGLLESQSSLLESQSALLESQSGPLKSDPNPACVGQLILLDVQGAVLALVVLQ